MTIDKRAEIHERVRRQHASELAQDYLEAIYELRRSGTPARIRALQETFGVSHVTVIRILKRLEEQGLIVRPSSREIHLTSQGEQLAQEARARHHLLRTFLVSLGVSEQQADADAEGAEHHLSQETWQAIAQHLEKTHSSR